jgi:hypothetical protein
MVHTPSQGQGDQSTDKESKVRPSRAGSSPKVTAAQLAWEKALATRLRTVVAGRSLRQVGTATGCNWETVRRYLAGGRASGRFLAAFANAYELNAEWLLHGVGPKSRQSRQTPREGRKSRPSAIVEIKHPKADTEPNEKRSARVAE